MELPEFNEIGNKVRGWQTEETNYYKSLPRSNYVLSALAFIGLVATCLPWADITIGFYNNGVSAVGLHFFMGWLCFLAFAAIIALLIFNKYLKIHEKYVYLLPMVASIVAGGLALAFMVWKGFKVHVGVYLTLVFAAAVLALFYYFKGRKV
ncbi:MAG: hypothetical protein WCQ95_11095 [Bacteroidota bacterium]